MANAAEAALGGRPTAPKFAGIAFEIAGDIKTNGAGVVPIEQHGSIESFRLTGGFVTTRGGFDKNPSETACIFLHVADISMWCFRIFSLPEVLRSINKTQ